MKLIVKSEKNFETMGFIGERDGCSPNDQTLGQAVPLPVADSFPIYLMVLFYRMVG